MFQYLLFAVLVVMTPFIVVTKYLQGAVHLFSHFRFILFGLSVPYVLAFAIVLFLAFLIWQRKSITSRRVLACLFIFIMIVLGHKTQDLYANLSYFDLQQNWHYVAYSAYTFFFFRAFFLRRMPLNRMIFIAFFSAIGLSTFDETFQFFMSHRIFDISDISKDAWGSLMGITLVLFVYEGYGTVELKWRNLWKQDYRDYLNDPFASLIIIWAFGASFMLVSPLLTEHEHALLLIILGLLLFCFILLMIHFAQFKSFRLALFAAIFLIIAGLGASYALNHKKAFTFNTYGISVYRGIPIVFFDYLIYPNGAVRLVDKKHFFNNLDKEFLYSCQEDILLIGSGADGVGGKGFPLDQGSIFIFVEQFRRGVQVIILKTPEACEVYNRLLREGKKVLFVVHNTC